MSTRSRSTRAAAAAGIATSAPAPISAQKKRASGKIDTKGTSPMDVDSEDVKENASANGSVNSKATSRKPTGTVMPGTTTKKSRTRKANGAKESSVKPVDCICSRGDDGSPMILCSECQIWYHFICVDITEPDAEEINVYICPTCTQTTGRRSAMNWEGDGAVEEVSDNEATIIERRKAALKTRKQLKQHTAHQELVNLNLGADESDEAGDSEDEYVEAKEVNEEVRLDKGPASRLRLLSSLSDSEEDSDDIGTRRRRRRLSRVKPDGDLTTPLAPQLKRKATGSSKQYTPPPTKRKRSGTSASAGGTDDPARKYCLGKLEDLSKEVFFRYPHVRTTNDEEEGDSNGQSLVSIVPKKLDELSEEEKEALVEESRQFAKELESCVFEIYSEPDKNGYPHAGGKYKDRFRMLQFNLSKPDRVMIHQRITSGDISGKEISLMSSTDLADEETKQSIKLAEKEALEHSILKQAKAPTAKITHKGLQDIEGVNGEVASARELERQIEREQEDDERREKERMARLRTTTQTLGQRQRTASMSVPPESPTTQQSITDQQQQPWGGPPPVPLHAMASSIAEDTANPQQQQQRPPLFIHSSSDFLAGSLSEPELNLADLINIDDDQEGGANATTGESSTQAPAVGPNFVASPTEILLPSPSPTSAVSTTGISPFAQRQRAPSFDLNSFWNAPKDNAAVPSDQSGPSESAATVEAETVKDDAAPSAANLENGDNESDSMELESVEANDQDFDMFLEEQEQEEPMLIISNIEQSVENLPQVWSGKITMPLDSTVPQETALVARQIGGKPISAESPLWKTLFPSDVLRVEGRVPVDNSVKYLLQMRMNATKEVYAAAFVPLGGEYEEDFKTFSNFLLSKNRHGLVFPWGNRPKDYHPGRELYMVPLLQSEPLPEFIELLDDLKLPKTRTRDYLIGVWILNKGKLAPLPGITPHSVTPQPAQSGSPSQPSPLLNIPMFSSPVPPAALGGVPGVAPSIPIAPAALAAEVASLTPEQIQSVLRTLASTTQVALPPLPQPTPPLGQPLPPQFNPSRPPIPPGSTPPMGHQSSPMPPGQNWTPHPPPPPAPYPNNFPPTNVPFQQTPHTMNTTPPSHYDQHYDQKDYDRRDYDHDSRQGRHYGQGDRDHGHRGDRGGERGWRGQNNNRGGRASRGRGRGRGDGYREGDRDFNDRRDSGWQRTSRNEGPSW